MSKDTPPPGAPPFDLGPLQEVMNDPDIANLAEQVANDPSFKQIQDILQSSFGQMGAGGGEAPAQTPASALEAPAGGGPSAPGGMPDLSAMLGGLNVGDGGGGMGAPGGLNMQAYMNSIQTLMGNPQFREMAEKLGKSIIEKQGPDFQDTFQKLNDPGFMESMKGKMESMKDDPELKPVLDDLEQNGPAAMYKYWNNPAVLAKFRGIYEGPEGLEGVAEGDGENEEEEEDLSAFPLVQAASDGALEDLKKLLKEGTDPNQADGNGRTSLHFAAGYGEQEVVSTLVEAGAKVDSLDETENTPLHYAAGYGQAQCCKQLLDKKANKEAKNQDGKTPLEVAVLNQQEEVVQLLKT